MLSVPEAIEDLLSMKRLWVHEVMRVYHDRIIDNSDSRRLIDTINDVCASKLLENIGKLANFSM